MKLAKYSAQASSTVAVLLLSAHAHGDAVTVVLVGRPTPAFERELSAEAAELGFSLVRDDGDEPSVAAAEHGAVAAVRVLSPGHVEVWFPQNRGQKAVDAREAVDTIAGETEPFAARVAEQVRAHLVKLALLPESPKPAALDPMTPVVPTAPSQRDESQLRKNAPRPATHPLWWSELGIGGIVSTGGVPGALEALVGLGASPGRFELEGFGLLPLTDSEISEAQGKAKVSVTMIGGRMRYVLSERGAVLRGALGGGGGALFLAMRGEAVSPYVGHDESAAAGAFFLDGVVGPRITSWFALRLSGLVGLCAPRPVVAFAGHDVATWGQTFGAITAAVELGIPAEENP